MTKDGSEQEGGFLLQQSCIAWTEPSSLDQQPQREKKRNVVVRQWHKD
jgi:hypothetical protein